MSEMEMTVIGEPAGGRMEMPWDATLESYKRAVYKILASQEDRDLHHVAAVASKLAETYSAKVGPGGLGYSYDFSDGVKRHIGCYAVNGGHSLEDYYMVDALVFADGYAMLFTREPFSQMSLKDFVDKIGKQKPETFFDARQRARLAEMTHKPILHAHVPD